MVNGVLADHDLLVRIDERVDEIKNEVIQFKADIKSIRGDCNKQKISGELVKQWVAGHEIDHKDGDRKVFGLSVGGGGGIFILIEAAKSYIGLK